MPKKGHSEEQILRALRQAERKALHPKFKFETRLQWGCRVRSATVRAKSCASCFCRRQRGPRRGS